MVINTKIFKDYDVRGIYPDQINAEVVKSIAYAIVRKFSPIKIAIGRDMRLSGKELSDAFIQVFTGQGIEVTDLGLIGTEMQYYTAGTYDFDLVIMLSASHNPPEYNGFKLVKKGPIAVTSESGLFDIRDIINLKPLSDKLITGKIKQLNVYPEWRNKILSLIDVSKIKPLSVVVDAGNGMAGKMAPYILNDLPVKLTTMYMDLDGSFPNHVPNPLIDINTMDLRKKIKEIRADVGFTFDGDADRIFLIDDLGRIVSGTITTALLVKYILEKYPEEMILYNAICGRIVPQQIAKLGGKSRRVRVGHSYIKTYMRETQAPFAGEHSGHYYYRDFFAAESGILTALIILKILSDQPKKLSQLVNELNIYAVSGEINFQVADIPNAIESIKKDYADARSIDEIDGISVWYDDYWFNIRASKTEPLLRLNVEADNQAILNQHTQNLISRIQKLGGVRK